MKARAILPAVASALVLAACTAGGSGGNPAPTTSLARTETSTTQAPPTAPQTTRPPTTSTVTRPPATSQPLGRQASATPTVKPTGVPLTTGKRSTYSLADLVVGTKVTTPKYQRESQFGAWNDQDHNGCDTRNDVLKRDLKNVTLKSGSKCLVASGTLRDPYVGDVVDFVRGANTSRTVQIDHVVPVADAWRSGAWKWSPAKRIAFYNDPLNLLAVEGAINTFKSDKTADRYLPPLHKCEYALVVIAVKDKYSLIVTAAEKTALNNACMKG